MASTAMVHLDQWASSQAALSDVEKSSVAVLTEWLSSNQPSAARPEEGSSRASAGMPSRPTTASSIQVAGPSLPAAPLADAPSYLAWFAKQQAHITSSTQTSHARALQRLTRAADEADVLLDHLEAARIHISELRAGARFVEEGSEGLREEAETMVERIDHLSQLAQALSLRLSYFAILPYSTSFLSSPSLSLVTSNDFLFTLDRLDIALAFVGAHPHYRDSPLYKMRFEHCVLRAGTLIRMYALARWKELSTEVSTKLREWEKSRLSKGKERDFDGEDHVMMNLADPPVYALLWERYEEESPMLRPVLAELEKRASSLAAPASTAIEAPAEQADPSGPTDEQSLLADYSRSKDEGGKAAESSMDVFRSPEFITLLSEGRLAYLEARRGLLSGIISNCLARIEVSAQPEPSTSHNAGTTTPLAAFIRRSLSFLSAVCEKEVALCRRFFAVEEDPETAGYKDLFSHVQLLCTPLDDRIRPRLAKETEPSALAAICLALVGDQEMESQTPVLVYSTLATNILKEAQDRLLARARQALAGSTLSLFTPKEEDIDYPAKLKKSQSHRRAQRSIGGAGLLEAAIELDGTTSAKKGFLQVDATSPITPTSSVRLFTLPSKAIVSSWYPPLSATLRLLAVTNDALPTTTFVDLASSAVDACRISIARAGDAMASQGGLGAGRIGLSGRMDVPLFLLRHLLLLREIAASVELRKASSGSLQVDRRVAGQNASLQSSNATIVDFAKLVETLNLLWVGLRDYGRGQAATPSATTDTHDPSQERSALEADLAGASNQFVDVVFQGVVLPLRVYMDQRSRSSIGRRSVSNVVSPPTASPAQETKSPPLASSAKAATTLSKARSAVQAFGTCAGTNLKEANEAMRLYLEDDRAIDGLADPIVDRIMETYSTFASSLEAGGLDVREVEGLLGAEEQRERLVAILKA